MKYYKFRISLINVVFLLIIFFPFINSNIKIIKDIESSENRSLTKEPLFDIKKLDPFPTKYEKYYNDKFSLRYFLIKKFNYYNIKFFNKSPIPYQVIIGNNGWLFMADNEIESYRGKDSFSNIELQELKLELEYRAKYLKDRGCEFYLMIVPAKSSIYSENIPKYILRLSNMTWGEQAQSYLKKNSNIKLIDLFEAFNLIKNKETIYYKLDNHWNELGAFYAANEFLNKIKYDFPEIKKLSLDSFVVKSKIKSTGNIVHMLNDTTLFEDTEYFILPKKGFLSKNAAKTGYPSIPDFPYNWDYENVRVINNSNSPKLLIISDSYGGLIFPFLSERFSKTVKIFDGWQYKLNEEIVNNEKPDIFLLIASESYFKGILKYQSRKK